MQRRPNVLLVFGDQWRAQACGYAGNNDVQTPHVDAFAATAINCQLASNGCPVCCAARASLLTGLLPDRHGVFLNDAPLSPELPSMGKHFRDAGYDTAWVGKWHVDGRGRYAFTPPQRRHGFDYWKALECTHDYNHSRYFADDPTMRIWEGYDAIAQTEDVVGWLESRRPTRPFFASLSWGPPHNPYETAPQRYRDLYDPDTLTLRDNVPRDLAADVRRDLAGYFAHCTALDDCFGRLLSALDRLGQADDTVVLFTSDHGDMLGSHRLWEKQGPWDESIRVPWLIRAPGLQRGTCSDLIIEFVDLWPTLAGLCGLPVAPGLVQGRDHSDHLRDGTLPEDNAAFYTSYHVYGTWPACARRRGAEALYQAREARGLRTSRYTYAIDRGGPWLLYDNLADPYQLENLINRPDLHHTQAALHAQLTRRMSAAEDDFPTGSDLIRKWGYTVNANGTIPHGDWRG